MDQPVKPPCFSTIRIYRKWLDSLPPSRADHADSICTDCLPGYQLRMKKLGLCAHPEVMFTIDDAGGVVGVTAEQIHERHRKSEETRKKMSESAKARWAMKAAA